MILKYKYEFAGFSLFTIFFTTGERDFKNQSFIGSDFFFITFHVTNISKALALKRPEIFFQHFKRIQKWKKKKSFFSPCFYTL